MSGPDLRLLSTLPEQERPVLLAHLLDELRDRLGVRVLEIERSAPGWFLTTEKCAVCGATLAECIDAAAHGQPCEVQP